MYAAFGQKFQNFLVVKYLMGVYVSVGFWLSISQNLWEGVTCETGYILGS